MTEHPPIETRLTAYPLPDTPNAPAILILPGGGYGGLAEHEGAPVAEWLNSLGIAAFVLSYPLGPEHRHPAQLDCARAAMRHLRTSGPELWGLDPSRIGVLGFSAGGHLAAHVSSAPEATVGERPDLAVLCYPVVSFERSALFGSTANLLGPDPTIAARRAVSVEYLAGAYTPPTFLWHTADDATVDVQHSLILAQELGIHGVPFELHVFPSGRHGLGLAEQESAAVAQWTGLCATWLREQGWAEPPA